MRALEAGQTAVLSSSPAMPLSPLWLEMKEQRGKKKYFYLMGQGITILCWVLRTDTVSQGTHRSMLENFTRLCEISLRISFAICEQHITRTDGSGYRILWLEFRSLDQRYIWMKYGEDGSTQ